MKTMSKLLCCVLAVLLCMSLVACTRTVVTESWVSVAESDTDSDNNQDNETPVDSEDTSDETSDTEDEDVNSDNSEDVNDPATSDDEPANSNDEPANSNDEPATSEDGDKPANTTTGKVQSGNQTTAKPQPGKTTTGKVQSGNKTTAKPQPGNTTTQVAATTKKTKGRGNSDTVYRNITIKKGSTKIEDAAKSTFKGKKYKAIIWTEIKEGFKEELAAFGKKYGCEFKMDSVNFESVVTTVSTKLASGEAYDLIRIQGSWYPRWLTQGLLAPLENAFTTADLLDSKKDGIDLNKSKYFGWNNQLYAITTYDDSPIYYMYYNKTILKGANDPMNLYKQGKWNWETMKKLASQYTGNNGLWWSDISMTGKVLPLSNGVSLLKETKKSDGGVKLEASISGNTKFINALKFMQSLCGLGNNGTGIYEKKQVLATDGGSDKFENLLTGKIVVWTSESNRFQKLYAQVKTGGTAMHNNPANLGVAPVPSGVDNDGSYAAGWLTAYAAGKGSDATAPQMVAAFTKFHSTYEFVGSSAIEKEAAKAYEKVRDSMYELYENVNYCDFGYGPTRQENMDIVLNNIETAVRTGSDITATLKKYDDQAAGYLQNSLSQQ